MLKIFFGADPTTFAGAQAAHHRGLAERFEAVRDAADRGEVEVGAATAQGPGDGHRAPSLVGGAMG